jgi:hypothetical protein
VLLGLKESNKLPTKPHFFTSLGEAEDGEVKEERGETKEGKGRANGVSLVEGDDSDDDDDEDEKLGLGLGLGLKLRLRIGY